jgi:hypothetical protein
MSPNVPRVYPNLSPMSPMSPNVPQNVADFVPMSPAHVPLVSPIYIFSIFYIRDSVFTIYMYVFFVHPYVLTSTLRDSEELTYKKIA